MKQAPAIKVVMTKAPMTIDAAETVLSAQRILSEKGFRHLPVMKGGKPVSMLSDRDINLALVANHGLVKAEEMTVEDVCTLATYTATPDSPLDEVVLNMADRQIGSVLVLDGERLAGIFTATDACRYLGLCLRGELV